MKNLINKYSSKLVEQGLAVADSLTFVCLDAEFSSNRDMHDIDPKFIRIFDLIDINSLLYAEPAEPYRSIITQLVRRGQGSLLPNDCENRTFLHDIPIIPEFTAKAVGEALSRRKAAIIGDSAIVSYGTVSPEQAFVSFSSVCFSTFVKFFTDVMYHLEDCRAGKAKRDEELISACLLLLEKTSPTNCGTANIPASPPANGEEVLEQMIATGRELTKRRLVDSYFGNISYILDNTIYISQTGSSMDELDACIDAVPLDGSSSTGITASSELSAHMGIYAKTSMRAILHGHPKFTVIMSMSCRREECDISACYKSCREKRSAAGIPVVSGEIGTGPTGLVRTVPDAMKKSNAVIVFGHGIFTADRECFRPAFALMQEAEEECMNEYFKKIQALI